MAGSPEITEEIMRRLRKMKRLAEKGVGGEAKAAEALMKRVAAKYRIDVNNVCSERRRFQFKGAGWRLSLILQLCAVICGVDGFQAVRTGRKNDFEIECEEAQWLEAMSRFKILEKDYKEQIGLFYEAFIVCNGLMLKDDGNRDGRKKEGDEDKARRVRKMATGLSRSRQPDKAREPVAEIEDKTKDEDSK